MIWPVILRYVVAVTAGYAFAVGTTLVRVLWAIALAALVLRDAAEAVREARKG